MKRVGAIVLAGIIAIFLLMGVCGCTMNPNEVTPPEQNNNPVEEQNTVLTERQKKILAEQGLSQDYSQLTSRQKMSITDIEQMLQAVESKYGKGFVYVDYNAEKELESGVLTAYPENGNKQLDAFTVMRDSADGFVDTYMSVVSRQPFEAYLTAQAVEAAGTDRIKTYSKVLETSLTPENLAPENFSGNLTADSWIFVDGAAMTEEAFAAFTETVTQWMQQEGLYGSVYFILLKEDHLMLLTKYNYTDYLTGDWVIGRQFCNVAQ